MHQGDPDVILEYIVAISGEKRLSGFGVNGHHFDIFIYIIDVGHGALEDGFPVDHCPQQSVLETGFEARVLGLGLEIVFVTLGQFGTPVEHNVDHLAAFVRDSKAAFAIILRKFFSHQGRAGLTRYTEKPVTAFRQAIQCHQNLLLIFR